MSRKRLLFMTLVGLVTLGSLLFAQTDVWAQRGGRPGAAGQGYTYVVKFICGEVTDIDADGGGLAIPGYGAFLAPGEYFTVINVHNPNEEIADYGLDWFKKIVTDYYVVQTGDDEADAGRPRFVSQSPLGATHIVRWVNQINNLTVGTETPPREKIQDFTLSRDEAAQMNCGEIRDIIQEADPSFDGDDLIKGFVIIYSRLQLDVTAIYTACDREDQDALDCDEADSPGPGDGVSTINVQRITPNGITPPAGIGLEDSAAFSGVSFPTTTSDTDCPQGGCQYVVKFVCGEISNPVQGAPLAGLESDLSPGEYYTDINIHNPNPSAVDVTKRFVVDNVIPEVTGALESPDPFSLEVDDAIQISCQDIVERANAAPEWTPGTSVPFFKGWVVITSLQRLDVVAVYSACRYGNTGDLNCGYTGTVPVTDSRDDVRSLEIRQGLFACDPDLKDEPACAHLSEERPDPAALPGAGGASAAMRPVVLQRGGSGYTFQLAGFGMWPMTTINVQVYNTQGRAVFTSGWQLGNRLDWRPLAMDGRPLANGVYIYVIQGKDALGRVVRTIGKFVVLR